MQLTLDRRLPDVSDGVGVRGAVRGSQAFPVHAGGEREPNLQCLRAIGLQPGQVPVKG